MSIKNVIIAKKGNFKKIYSVIPNLLVNINKIKKSIILGSVFTE